MRHPEHLISGPRKGITPERMAGLFFGGLIPAVFIWALIAGLIPNITKVFEPPIVTHIIAQKPLPPDHPPASPTMQGARVDTPEAPVWTTDNGPTTTIHDQGGGNQTVFVPDTPARGVMSTHTTPPYPSLEARLGQAGTVLLKLSIASDGSVVDATVENSSGSDRLDQAAIDWVKAHWRYQPAMHEGTAVATTAEAAVRFDLKNAMR